MVCCKVIKNYTLQPQLKLP